jgi:hypothetical protein
MAILKETEAGVWYLSDDWHIEDVQNVRPDLDDDQCIDVLCALAEGFDANNGINWEVIEYTADAIYPTTEENDDD